jgi:hypothetical protein
LGSGNSSDRWIAFRRIVLQMFAYRPVEQGFHDLQHVIGEALFFPFKSRVADFLDDE